MIRRAVRQILELYPRIFLACHRQHLRDPKAGRLLSSRQVSILEHLDPEEPMNLKDLALHMGVTPATMCIAVERLVRQGYVVRDRDGSDGRRVNLRLSGAGVRIKNAQTVLDPDRLRSLLVRLSPEERAQAVHGLELLAQAAQEEMRSRSLGRSWSRRAARS